MTKHTIISYWKSVFRVIGYIMLFIPSFQLAASCLLLAEFLGVIEELPGMYKGTDIDERTKKMAE